ncbi:MAG: nuclease A inhibitor family protein [Oculatellaceae cyanobacterium bins.114]|nr:nuclease A inhibitor family protein [Oculatellaceae cyanobacterium bins.114]
MTSINPDLALINTLRDAVDDLYYMSESDRPFEVWSWSGQSVPLNSDSLLQGLGKPHDSQVEERSLDTFFERLMREQDWQSDQERAIAQRFRRLFDLIAQNLTNTNVYRIGDIEIDIYIVGQTELGDWIVLHTQAVET